MKASYEPGKVKATSANWVNGYGFRNRFRSPKVPETFFGLSEPSLAKQPRGFQEHGNKAKKTPGPPHGR
jgi:hypothetical protein